MRSRRKCRSSQEEEVACQEAPPCQGPRQDLDSQDKKKSGKPSSARDRPRTIIRNRTAPKQRRQRRMSREKTDTKKPTSAVPKVAAQESKDATRSRRKGLARHQDTPGSRRGVVHMRRRRPAGQWQLCHFSKNSLAAARKPSTKSRWSILSSQRARPIGFSRAPRRLPRCPPFPDERLCLLRAFAVGGHPAGQTVVS